MRSEHESPSASELIAHLNDLQREAVLHGEGPLLILAGAGSGKTRVITHRMVYLSTVRGVAPYRIAAVTFTNKAAKEMKNRLIDLTDPSTGGRFFVRTFHGLGLYILRRNAEAIGLKPNFTIYDETDQKRLIKEIMKSYKIDPKLLTPESIIHTISRCKDDVRSAEDYIKISEDSYAPEIYKVYKEYSKKMRENNAVDFGDLLYETVLLFENNTPLLHYYQNLWRYFFIDEYQDTNHAQYRIGKFIAKEHHNIAVVGDDDQSIYSWRGACISNILEFEKDYPECKVLRLEENYRSTMPILSVASSMIKNNMERHKKTLFTRKEGGDKVKYHVYPDDQAEARDLAQKIIFIKKSRGRWSDFAIFYRTNAQSRIFEQTLIEYGIPVVIYGGFRFFERQEIKEMIAYLSVVVNPDDDISLERIINTPARGVGTVALERLKNHAYHGQTSLYSALARCKEIASIRSAVASTLIDLHHKFESWRSLLLTGERPSRIADHLARESGILQMYKDKLEEDSSSRAENIREFIGAIEEYEEQFDMPYDEEGLSLNDKPTLESYLQNISLYTSETNPSKDHESGDAVHLMTFHNAKGLEFTTVFITGLEENLIPHSRSVDEGYLEEERRLLYVGVTRAKRSLYMSSVLERRLYGRVDPRVESRFLSEMDKTMLEVSGGSHVFRGEGSVRGERHNSPFRRGERVLHEKLGPGVVVFAESLPDSGQKLGIVFEEGEPPRYFLTKHAPIIKI